MFKSVWLVLHASHSTYLPLFYSSSNITVIPQRQGHMTGSTLPTLFISLTVEECDHFFPRRPPSNCNSPGWVLSAVSSLGYWRRNKVSPPRNICFFPPTVAVTQIRCLIASSLVFSSYGWWSDLFRNNSASPPIVESCRIAPTPATWS